MLLAAERRDRGRGMNLKKNMQRPKLMNEKKKKNHEDEGKEFGGFKDSGFPVM